MCVYVCHYVIICLPIVGSGWQVGLSCLGALLVGVLLVFVICRCRRHRQTVGIRVHVNRAYELEEITDAQL